MALYKELASFVSEHYWDLSFEAMADEKGCGISTIQRAANHAGLPRKTETNHLEYKYGVPLPWLLDTLHNILERSVNQMSNELGVSRIWIDRQMYEYDIHKRGRSEAERLKWSQMTDEERKNQVAAAHRASQTLPRLRAEKRGDVGIRHLGHHIKHHRLLATLLVDDIQELRGKHVHHKVPRWPNGPDDVSFAVDFLDNLEVLDPEEHLRNHYQEREIDGDGRFT